VQSGSYGQDGAPLRVISLTNLPRHWHSRCRDTVHTFRNLVPLSTVTLDPASHARYTHHRRYATPLQGMPSRRAQLAPPRDPPGAAYSSRPVDLWPASASASASLYRRDSIARKPPGECATSHIHTPAALPTYSPCYSHTLRAMSYELRAPAPGFARHLSPLPARGLTAHHPRAYPNA
jgi:hypothetical protein